MIDILPYLPWLFSLLSFGVAIGIGWFQARKYRRIERQHQEVLLAHQQKHEAQLDAFRRQHTETLLAQQDEHQAILRRREREAEKQRERAVVPLLLALIPALDALEQAQRSTHQPDTSLHDLAQGIEILQHTFLQALAQQEIHPIQPTSGVLFDPEEHESIGLIDAPNLPPSSVAQTLRTGWRLRDTLLRPATVQTTPPAASFVPAEPSSTAQGDTPN